MRRLQGRDGVLVDELDMSATFEDQAELVEPATAPWSITPLTRKSVIRSCSRAAAPGTGPGAALSGRPQAQSVGTKSGGGSEGMIVEIACL